MTPRYDYLSTVPDISLLEESAARDGARPEFSVVIPVFNEGAVIGDIVANVRETLGLSAEIIVVDDGSSDLTRMEAERAGAKVVALPVNGGNGAAIKTGIRHATGEIICFMDGDGQHTSDDLLKLIEHAGTYDMVVGARSSNGQASLLRRVANSFWNRLASWMTDRKVEDLTSGFRVVRRTVAQEFLPLLPNGFSYPTTITLSSMRAGYSVRYVPIDVQKRVGKSKIRIFRDGAKFFIIMFKITTLFSPIKIFLPLAAIPTIGAFVAAGLSLFGSVNGWTMATILFTSAMSLTGLGLISEQICAMRFERLNVMAETRALRMEGVER